MISLNRIRLVGLMALVLAACSSEPEKTDCPRAYCDHHGVCTEQESLPTCACDEGYVGLTCASCAKGFHRVGTSFCAADEICSDRSCNGHGTCGITSGAISCACDPGWGGASCGTCAVGFVFVPDTLPEAPDAGQPDVADPDAGESDAGESDAGESDAGGLDAGAGLPPGTCRLQEFCAPTSCAPGFACSESGGIVSCTCLNETCAACSADTCGAHGSCDDRSGFASCTCAPGYRGPKCDGCQPGYSPDASGACVLDVRCLPQTCSGHGLCDVSGGAFACDCTDGYAGDWCEACAEGFHRDDTGACLANQTCAGRTCPAHATCDASSGLARCPCDKGYAGETCTSCAPGFHRVTGGACVLDQRCTATSCGRGTCEDATGTIVCTCPTDATGTWCETPVTACGDACQTGTCVALSSGLSCVCTDGTWGPSCPPGPSITSVSPATGDQRGGYLVRLSGTTFVAGATVTLGGATPPNLSISSSQISFIAPAPTSLGPVEVLVTNPNGQKTRATFTYTPVRFTYTGAAQRFTVPANVTSVLVQAWGAGGGAGEADAHGGAGGFAQGRLGVAPGDVLAIVVGQGGARVTSTTKAGGGGGYSGAFAEPVSAASARLVAGGGGGGGFLPGAHGGDGGGAFGGDGRTPSTGSEGLAGSDAAGGLGGCLADAQCGLNGAALTGGGGGLPDLASTRSTPAYGGGGAVGRGASFASAGGGGGWFGGGGGSGGGGGGAGGGSGWIAESATDPLLLRGERAGVVPATDRLGYGNRAGTGGVDATAAGDGLVLVSW